MMNENQITGVDKNVEKSKSSFDDGNIKSFSLYGKVWHFFIKLNKELS